ncbi:heterokaryon incompatibility protein-domain-containing protein, partial [Sordaria brevicollis]
PREHRVAMIQRWLSRCERDHGQKCGHYFSETNFGDKLLVVDVQRGCLAEITPCLSKRYFALSYVWGRQATFQTLKQNVERLRQPGSISYSSDMLPRTIRDAIQLLIALNERYLWCDRLCIIQDDSESKHSSISRMNVIFGGAYAVIMARSGSDAEAGLLSPGHGHPWHRVCRLSDSMRFVTVPSSRAEEGAGLAPLEGHGFDSVDPVHWDKNRVGMPEDIKFLCGNVEVIQYPFRDLGLEAPLTLGALRFYTLCASFEM